jgi:signal transduction histidine kinase
MATPINSIKLRANRLLRKSDQHASDLQNDIQSIFQSIQSCESVLKKLTNVHLDPDEVIFQDQDLSELIRTCVEIWQRELTPDNTKISLDLPDTAWLTLPGIMMTQAILDLLDNAYEAIDESSESGHIWVSLKEHAKSLELVVADNGEGFPEHIRSRLGEPFNTSKSNGNGLGLYHASLLSQLMGGELRVGSRQDGGKGAAVTITFEKEKHVESRTTANFNR